MASNPQEPASGFTEGKSYADCQACRTATHCDFHKRCLAECSPKDLRASGGSQEPASGSILLVDSARQAVTTLRDFAREHGMHCRQRDPLVMTIYDALAALSQAQATIEALTRERDEGKAALCYVDRILDRRDALAPFGSRAEKILHLIRCAQTTDPKGDISRLEAALAALRSEQARLRAEIDSAWRYIEMGYDIEPRSFFESAEERSAGWTSPLEQAMHHIWKRNPRVAQLEARCTAQREQLARIRTLLRVDLREFLYIDDGTTGRKECIYCDVLQGRTHLVECPIGELEAALLAAPPDEGQ